MLYPRFPGEEVIKGLTRIVDDLANKKINVNNIRNKKNREDYLETFAPDEIPNKSESSEKPVTLGSASTQTKRKGTKGTKARSTQRKALIPSSCILRIDQSRINDIYRELKSLEVNRYPNATAVMFRVFLEVSLDEYASKYSVPDWKNDAKLVRKVQVVAKHLESIGVLKKDQLKAVRTGVSNENSLFSINTFNAYVHNKHLTPVPTDLKFTWDNYQLFVEKIWEQLC